MKTLSILTVAIMLGLGGVAMAGDSGENHQDNTNLAGANPYMPELGAPAARASAAYAQVSHQAHQTVKK
jgi:hypothetical protein